MSVDEMIKLAVAIVKGERVIMPKLEWWQFDEIMWWTKNLDGALV